MNIDIQALKMSLQNSIKKAIEKEGFVKYDIVIKNLNTRGDNYVGTLYEIDIKGVTHESEKEINAFVKEKIIWKNISLFNTDELYANEELIYKDISKVIMSLQDEADVPTEDRFRMAKAYDETNNDAIILENLCKKGYIRYDKNERTSLKYFELGVQELAKLHALSFAIEKKMPDYFREKIAALENPFHFDEKWNDLMRMICGYLANLYEYETKTKIENFIPVLIEKFPKYQNDKTSICTLSHGDYKKNNVMDGVLQEMLIIDYQLLDYGCPIRDLILFLIFGSDKEFRRDHLHYAKDLYFEKLSKFLKYFDIDVENVFPKRKFEKIFVEWLDYGLMFCLFFSVFIFAENGIDVQNLAFENFSFHPNEADEKSLRDLIDDYVEWGYL